MNMKLFDQVDLNTEEASVDLDSLVMDISLESRDIEDMVVSAENAFTAIDMLEKSISLEDYFDTDSQDKKDMILKDLSIEEASKALALVGGAPKGEYDKEFKESVITKIVDGIKKIIDKIIKAIKKLYIKILKFFDNSDKKVDELIKEFNTTTTGSNINLPKKVAEADKLVYARLMQKGNLYFLLNNRTWDTGLLEYMMGDNTIPANAFKDVAIVKSYIDTNTQDIVKLKDKLTFVPDEGKNMEPSPLLVNIHKSVSIIITNYKEDEVKNMIKDSIVTKITDSTIGIATLYYDTDEKDNMLTKLGSRKMKHTTFSLEYTMLGKVGYDIAGQFISKPETNVSLLEGIKKANKLNEAVLSSRQKTFNEYEKNVSKLTKVKTNKETFNVLKSSMNIATQIINIYGTTRVISNVNLVKNLVDMNGLYLKMYKALLV